MISVAWTEQLSISPLSFWQVPSLRCCSSKLNLIIFFAVNSSVLSVGEWTSSNLLRDTLCTHFPPPPYSWRHWQQSSDISRRDLPAVGSPQTGQHSCSLERVLDLDNCFCDVTRFEWYVYQSGPEACSPLLRLVGSRMVKELHWE